MSIYILTRHFMICKRRTSISDDVSSGTEISCKCKTHTGFQTLLRTPKKAALLIFFPLVTCEIGLIYYVKYF